MQIQSNCMTLIETFRALTKIKVLFGPHIFVGWATCCPRDGSQKRTHNPKSTGTRLKISRGRCKYILVRLTAASLLPTPLKIFDLTPAPQAYVVDPVKSNVSSGKYLCNLTSPLRACPSMPSPRDNRAATAATSRVAVLLWR